jgi:hypothetical protein
MMHKDEYKAAIAKLKASDKFKEKAEASMKASSTKANSFKLKRLAPLFAALLMFACISAGAINHLLNNKDSATVIPPLLNDKNSTTAAGDFKITSQVSDANACYKSIVYLEGYEYSPSSWLNYSRQESIEAEDENLKGENLGTVTLDLKGKTYTGTPPSFSSTHDVGTEVYTVKGMKKERAILVVSNGHASIFYRERKAIKDEKTPINLTLAEVFSMISDSPKVASVELRSEQDGSWMGASGNKELLELVNKELPKLPLLQASDMGKNPYEQGNRIPINLIFSDGSALHMQVIPEAKSAYVFGGFVRISEELNSVVQKLPKLVEQYSTTASLLPYTEDQVAYLQLINHTNGDEVLCKTPQWSREPLFSILKYYPVIEAQASEANKLVMTAALGKSKDNSATLDFYENSDKHIVIKLNGKYYKPVKGQMSFEELSSYLYNYTDLGMK